MMLRTELAALEEGSYTCRAVTSIGICDLTGSHFGRQYLDALILLPSSLHEDRPVDWVVLTWSRGRRDSICAICESVGEETSLSSWDIHSHINFSMGRCLWRRCLWYTRAIY